MGLYAYVFEAAVLGAFRKIAQVSTQRNFGPREHQTTPLTGAMLRLEDVFKLLVRACIQVIHGAFNHTMHTLEVTPELHADGDILFVISQRIKHFLLPMAAIKEAHKSSFSQQ